MDTLSHGLWAAAAAKGINLKVRKKISVGRMALWGIVPDIFSFSPALLWVMWQVFYAGIAFKDVPRPETMSLEVRNTFFIYRLTDLLYHAGHSVFIFLVVFMLGWAYCRFRSAPLRHSEGSSIKDKSLQVSGLRPPWEMTGWLVHILMDIPTHSATFYPTLFLWPLSEWSYDGDSWGTMHFMVTNYTLLILVFVLLWLLKKFKREEGPQ